MKRLTVWQTAIVSLCCNLLYSFYTAGLGLSTVSWWFLALSAYYILLSVMRFAVLLWVGKGKKDHFIPRFTGWVLMGLSVVLAGLTYMSMDSKNAPKHHEIVMITMALYAFLKITLAIMNLIKAGKMPSPALRTLRNIGFADALASIFSLQRSMLVSFGEMSEMNITLFNALTGTAVYLLVFLTGLNLIGGKRIIMAKSKLVTTGAKIADGVTEGYKKIETGVIDGYKKIEKGVVDGYTKIEDKFIDQFLTREGETVEEAKIRLKKKTEE